MEVKEKCYSLNCGFITLPHCMVRILFILSLLVNAPTEQDSASLGALEGVWRMKTSKGYLYEEWTLQGSGLKGKSYRLNGTDSVVLERLRIVTRSDGTFYESLVTGQNQGQVVGFRLVKSTGSSFVFENPQHDYPQRILYTFITSDSVVARIEGEKDGKIRGSDYNYKKSK